MIYANPNTDKCSISIPDDFKNGQIAKSRKISTIGTKFTIELYSAPLRLCGKRKIRTKEYH
jgi:hypothetical protein